jgi:hypothetical protein
VRQKCRQAVGGFGGLAAGSRECTGRPPEGPPIMATQPGMLYKIEGGKARRIPGFNFERSRFSKDFIMQSNLIAMRGGKWSC